MECPGGSRVDPKKAADYSRDLLDSPEVRNSLNTLREIVKTCYGPHGKIKTIQNCSGGHLTLTSVSSRLFSAVSVSKPVLKLLVGSLQGHLVNYGDGGLFTSLFSLILIYSALDLQIQRHLIVDLFDSLLKMSVYYLRSPDCSCKRKVELGNLDILMKFVRSIIGTKPACGLYAGKLDFLCSLLVEAFLKSLPDSQNQELLAENIIFVPKSGSPVTKSRIIEGILLDTCERETLIVRNKTLKRIANDDGKLMVSVALINVSMSGDLEDFITAAAYEVESDVDVDRVSVQKLRVFAEALVKAGAGAVFCQKVIHPSVKRYFRESGIVMMDRLGLAMCLAIKHLTGASLISCVSPVVDKGSFGQLCDISVEELDKKSYILLTSEAGKVVTVLLYNTQDEAVAELKAVCESAVQSLHRYLIQPEFLMGGGCWQTHLAAYVRCQVHSRVDEMTKVFDCTKSQLLCVTETFAHSLELCAISVGQDGECHMTDTANQHLWRAPTGSWDTFYHEDDSLYPSLACSCGEFLRREVTALTPILGKSTYSLSCTQKEKVMSHEETQEEWLTRVVSRPVVLDLFAVQLNALQTAVMMTNVVLGVHQYIHDKN